MKALVFALSAAALVSAASAQAVTGTVDITGSVAAKCQFTTANALIALGELAGPTGTLNAAVVNAGTATLVGWCNGTASTMAVTSAPIVLTPTIANPAGFENRIDYTATASATSASLAATVTASDSSVGALSIGPSAIVGLFSSNIGVSLSAAATPGGGKLIAGSYVGQVTVTLTPAV